MQVLIGNIVKTEVADYPCATREEAEALYFALRYPHREDESPEPSREIARRNEARAALNPTSPQGRGRVSIR